MSAAFVDAFKNCRELLCRQSNPTLLDNYSIYPSFLPTYAIYNRDDMKIVVTNNLQALSYFCIVKDGIAYIRTIATTWTE